MDEENYVQPITQIDKKLLNFDDTLSFLKDGYDAPVIRFKLVIYLSLLILFITIFFIEIFVFPGKILSYILLVISIIFFNSG